MALRQSDTGCGATVHRFEINADGEPISLLLPVRGTGAESRATEVRKRFAGRCPSAAMCIAPQGERRCATTSLKMVLPRSLPLFSTNRGQPSATRAGACGHDKTWSWAGMGGGPAWRPLPHGFATATSTTPTGPEVHTKANQGPWFDHELICHPFSDPSPSSPPLPRTTATWIATTRIRLFKTFWPKSGAVLACRMRRTLIAHEIRTEKNIGSGQ